MSIHDGKEHAHNYKNLVKTKRNTPSMPNIYIIKIPKFPKLYKFTRHGI